MSRRHGLPVVALALLTLFLLGYSVSVRVPTVKGHGFVSDEATYYAMAYSLAFDADIRYERHDLERVYSNTYSGGPVGLFLKRNPLSGRLYFAKSFAYPAAAAPFVRLLGDNGFLVLHGLLLAIVLGTGYLYLVRWNRPAVSALYAVTYVVASVAFAYYFWMTPEWFSLAVLFVATFLWLYKLPPPGRDRPATGWTVSMLTRPWTDHGAVALYGVAAFVKLPHLVFAVPLLVSLARQRKWRRAIAAGLLLVLACAALFGANWWATGEWNYQGGDRRSYYSDYPLRTPAATFSSGGNPMATGVGSILMKVPVPRAVDLVYVLVGRNAGLAVYMFPALLAVALFLSRRREDLRRHLWTPHGLLLGAGLVYLLFFLSFVGLNWIGGGGTLGGRYFIGLYAVAFFLIPAGVGIGGAAVAWTIAALFLAQIHLNPWESAFRPSMHTKAFPFTLLPAELSILHQLPFNTNPRARRISLEEGAGFFLYFLDDNAFPPEPGLGGFWTAGESTAEVVVRTMRPADGILLDVRNGPEPNRVEVRLEGQRLVRRLQPHASVTLELTPGRGFPYLDTYLYRLEISSRQGFVPRLSRTDSNDVRHLGVFVSPRLGPQGDPGDASRPGGS